MAKMGDWREDPKEEIALDGIGGVNIVVKADVHKSGKLPNFLIISQSSANTLHRN